MTANRATLEGGHRWPGEEGKSPFTREWSDEKIMHEISDIATDPSTPWIVQSGSPGSDFTKTGDPSRYIDAYAKLGFC